MTSDNRRPVVVVSLGTDHHKFDRLVDWIDTWLEQRSGPVDCLVQHGFSRPPRLAAAVERIPRVELLELYRSSDVVVVQGGPGSILDVREVGKIPIAVPRRAELDEVVDDHQKAFTEVMAEQGDAILVDSYASFAEKLEFAISNPATVTTAPRIGDPEAATRKLEAAVLERMGATDKGRTRRRIMQVLTSRQGRSGR